MNIKEYHPVDPAYRALIEERLSAIEKKHNVEIIYACESGSRAWGFASPDSDYDVRFIYVRKPLEYLTIGEYIDHIQDRGDDTIDFSGWDIKKALGMLHKGNPAAIERMRSPIVYRSLSVGGSLRERALSSFRPRSAVQHYFDAGLRTYAAHLLAPSVHHEHVFIALRCALAVEWIMNNGTMPPVPMSNLLSNSKLIPKGSRLREAIIDTHEEIINPRKAPTSGLVKVIDDFLTGYYAKDKKPDFSAIRRRQGLPQSEYDAMLRTIVFSQPL